MEDIRKRVANCEERLTYLSHIKGEGEWGNLSGLRGQVEKIKDEFYNFSEDELRSETKKLEDSLDFLEARCEDNLSPLERIQIVRSPLRFSLKDILENVYEDYTELGGEGDANIDPSMIAAKANIMRRVKTRSMPSR